MNKRHILLALVLGAAIWLSFFAPDTVEPEAQIAEPLRPQAADRKETSLRKPDERTRSTPVEPGILHLRERAVASNSPAAVLQAESLLFSATTWEIPPKPLPPPPPQAPALPYGYIGKMLKDGSWEVFLSRGESTRVIHLHEVLDTQYRVESIQPPTLTLIYLPLGQVQTMNIGKPE